MNMGRVKEILKMWEDEQDIALDKVVPFDKPNFIVAMAGDPPHTHEMHVDSEGNGALGDASIGEPHVHNMTNWEVQPAGSYPHIHAIVKEEVISPTDDKSVVSPEASSVIGEADMEHDDIISDTKQKVKVVTPKASPNVRRVFDKTGKYVGSFDTKNKIDHNKYKTMFKAAK